jgi:hypothetical protein
MNTSFITLKSTTLSLLVGGLALIGLAEARSIQDHDHGKHDHAAMQAEASKTFAGDPYLLSTDAVSGKPLGPIAQQVIVQHEGRELRFAGQKTAAAFKAAPSKFLPAVDKKMIAQQLPYYPMETCVVSGEELDGDMGEAVDVIYKNRLVRLCCNGCKKKLAKDPAGVIGKIDKAVLAAQVKSYPLKTCAVSGDELGEMGDPIDMVVGNRLVRLCCKGCKKKLAKDPLAYLAKLGSTTASSGGKGHGGHGDGHGDHDH